MEMVATAPATLGPADIGLWAARAERLGFDTVHISETIHDPFTVAAFALQATTDVTVRTSMVLAFPRSPMITAYAAWDLARLSGGRFQLGIASQVRGNIVGRFSTAWSEPVARMADYIRALRAIFHAFQSGERLNYVGAHYTFDKLQPYFNPGPLDHPAPAIWTGGVNARMVAMAGELADGFVCHPTNSHPTILRTQTLPSLGGGSARVIANPQPLMARTGEDVRALRDTRRGGLAFLYSTPAYRRQLEHFGLADLGAALSDMAQGNQWDGMSRLVTDDVLERIIPHGTYDEIPELLGQWYAGLCDGLTIALPAGDDDALAELVRRSRVIPTLSG